MLCKQTIARIKDISNLNNIKITSKFRKTHTHRQPQIKNFIKQTIKDDKLTENNVPTHINYI